jgi:hypothetical protein
MFIMVYHQFPDEFSSFFQPRNEVQFEEFGTGGPSALETLEPGTLSREELSWGTTPYPLVI